MEVIETKLSGCREIMPQVFGDHRGWFYESYSKVKLPELDCDFVQDNHSYTQKKGTHSRRALPEQPGGAGEAGPLRTGGGAGRGGGPAAEITDLQGMDHGGAERRKTKGCSSCPGGLATAL